MSNARGVCDVDRTVSENLRAILARRRITARSVADVLDIAERPFRRRLRAEVGWSVSEVMRVAEHLDVEVGDLMVKPEGEV